MILAVDVGNTNIVVGVINDGIIEKYERIRTEANATTAEYAIKLTDLLNYMKYPLNCFDGAVVSTVVPQLKNSLLPAIKELTSCEPMLITNKTNTGITYKVDDPDTVAGDLIVGAVAAKEYYGAPAIIMDLGTATTITVLDTEGAFCGGAILPGIRLGLGALASGTALLPEISISAPEKAISTNTVDCLRSGAVVGNAALIDGMVDIFEKELGYECNLIATGGLASSVVKYCKHSIICDDDLLLKGLWSIYERNK